MALCPLPYRQQTRPATHISAHLFLSVLRRKMAGVTLGRPKGTGKSKLDQHRAEIEKMLGHGVTQKHIARKFDTTEANLSRWMKKHGLRRNAD